MRHILAPLLVLLAAVVAPLGAQTATDTRPYHDTIAGYTVQVPARWTRMPQGMVDLLTASAPRAADGSVPPAAGWRGPRRGNSPLPPMLYVIPYRDSTVRQAAFVAQITSAGATAARDDILERVHAAPGGASMTVGTMTWDAEAGVGWVAGGATTPDGIEVRMLAATRPVDGWGQMIVGIVSGDGSSFEEMRARILRVVTSFAVDDRPAAP